MTVECDAILLGREPIHGTANASALASLVKGLIKKPDQPRKRYVLRCGKEHGVQMIPYHHRGDDEGFESDEDLTSLGSSEDAHNNNQHNTTANNNINSNTGINSNSEYPPNSSNNNNNNNNNHSSDSSLVAVEWRKKPINSSQTAADKSPPSNVRSNSSSGGSGSVSSIGTDSANSSGGSDNDETEMTSSQQYRSNGISGGNNNNANKEILIVGESYYPVTAEAYQFHEIAFCHTDANFPRIVVWVAKTKRKSKTMSEITYGLEAIVFSCRNEEKFRAICKHFQELSRRSKLEKPVIRYRNHHWTTGDTTIFHGDNWNNRHNNNNSTNYRVTVPSKIASSSSEQQLQQQNHRNGRKGSTSDHRTATESSNYNLIQRIDTDGVTHIEVSRAAAAAAKPQCANGGYFPSTVLTDSYEPSSIISINTPESGNVHCRLPTVSDNQIESVICLDGDTSFLVDKTGRRCSSDTLVLTDDVATIVDDDHHQSTIIGQQEKKKHVITRKSYGKEKAPDPPQPSSTTALNNKAAAEKVVRGQYVRVTVDHHQTSYPSSSLPPPPANTDITTRQLGYGGNVRFLRNEVRPCGNNMLSYPSSKPNWTAAAVTTEDSTVVMNNAVVRKGHRSQQPIQRNVLPSANVNNGHSQHQNQNHHYQQHHHKRSKSSGPYLVSSKKSESKKGQQYNNSNNRYIEYNNSLPNRFFGKLKELTLGSGNNNNNNNNNNNQINHNRNSSATNNKNIINTEPYHFRRRNSIGELANAGRFYQYPEQNRPLYYHHLQQTNLAKSTPNLKSVIKNKNSCYAGNSGKFHKEASGENEPKKVTFSAYATVQVVD